MTEPNRDDRLDPNELPRSVETNNPGAELPDEGTHGNAQEELAGEFDSYRPAQLPRTVEENDIEWQRTGGAPAE